MKKGILVICCVLLLLIGGAIAYLAQEAAPTCPDDRPMRHRSSCEPCNTKNISISKKECEKCPDLRVFEQGHCLFKKSLNQIRPLFTIGIMFDSPDLYAEPAYCDDKRPAETSKSNCDQCPNREYKYGKCVLKETE